MDTSYYDYLRNIIPKVIPSKSMQDYLLENIEILEKWRIVDMIFGSPVSLHVKKEIFQTLAAFENVDIRKTENEGDDDHWMRIHDSFCLYDQLTTEVLEDIQPSETGFFLLRSYCWEAPEQKFTDCTPFCTIEEVMNYLETIYAGEDITYIWHYLERWERIDGELKEVREYIIVNNQICYFGDNSFCYLPYCGHSAHLNLPVPFRPGDFVEVDGQPFCGKKIAMIIGVGDNHDCCCLQAVYLDHEGNMAYGAVKHGTVFEACGKTLFPLMSPLYRIKPFCEEIPDELKPLLILQKYLTDDPHLIDDIYMNSMMRFQKIEEITEDAMQEIHKECVFRYQQFLENRRTAASYKKSSVRPTPKRVERMIRKYVAQEYGKAYADLVLDGFEVDTCNEKQLILYSDASMRCNIIRDRLLPEILNLLAENYGIYPEGHVILVV